MAQGKKRIAPERRSALPEGTLLRRRYEIRGVREVRGTVLVYHALDTKERRCVDVTEYYPAGLGTRTADSAVLSPRDKRCGERFFAGSEAFYAQHAALTQAVGSRNLMPVYDAFFENGTAYAILADVEGVTLKAYLEDRQRTLTDGEFAFLFSAMADALLVIHSLSITHGDLSGEAILLTTDGGALLTRYGAADALLSGAQGDDIALLGRTLYEAYAGAPFDGKLRFPADGSAAVRAILERMLTDDPARRFSGVFDLLHAASGLDSMPEAPLVARRSVRAARGGAAEAQAAVNGSSPAEPDDTVGTGTRAHSGKPAPRWLVPVIGAVLLLLVAALVAALFRR